MRWLGAILCAALAAPSALGQGLRDPMRPPGIGAEAAPAAAPAGSGLQGIVTSPHRKLAVIDGAVVPLGAVVRAGELVGVSDSAAVLRKGDSRDVILMHPEIGKRPAGRSRPREPEGQ